MSSSMISVGLFCRVLPKYRLGIYERLSQRPEIDLTVLYSKEPSYYSLKTVNPDGRFKSELIEMRAWRFGKQEFLYHPDASRLIKSGRFDVVILPGNPRLLSNFPALWACKKHRVGIVWWGMGTMPRQSGLTFYVRRKLMDIPEALVFYTKDEKKFFVSHGIPAEKVFVAQNTICTMKEKEAAGKWSPDLLAAFARENGFLGSKIFLFCGQLREKKRIDWLLSAFRDVLAKGYDYRLFIIGPDGTGGKFQNLASQKGLGDAARFLGPIYAAEQLAPWFLSARALVVPRAIGLAALHGFGFGLPCITSRDRRYQTPEAAALRDGYNSLMYEDGNIDDLSTKIIQLGEDDSLHIELSCNARRTMEEEYTVDKMVDGFCEAIAYAKKQVSHR